MFHRLHRALARECLPPTLALAARDTSTLSSASTHGGVEEGWASNGQVWWVPRGGAVQTLIDPASTRNSQNIAHLRQIMICLICLQIDHLVPHLPL